jgi:hypothetical protein
VLNSFIFCRPPYNTVELQGKVQRFETRVCVRYDYVLTKEGMEKKAELLSDILEDTLKSLSVKVKDVFGLEFLTDEPVLHIETVGGVEPGMILILGANFKKLLKKTP